MAKLDFFGENFGEVVDMRGRVSFCDLSHYGKGGHGDGGRLFGVKGCL